MRFYLIIILVLAVFLRLYNFSGNFSIDGDGGRDVMIAREAINRGEIPLTGPFTSAGPFVFGPFFYWFIIGAYRFLPFGLFSPWVMIFIAGIFFIFLMIVIANETGGKKLAIVVGLLAAFSPQMIVRSRALTQHTMVAIFAALAMFFYILLWKRKKSGLAFFLGITLGIAVSLHYQAINLLLFLPAVFLIPKINWKVKITYFLLTVIGFILPSLPLLIWDSHQNFANINNILDYFLIGQYRLYVPSSWKLFLFTQFPGHFAFVTGGLFPVGLILFLTSTFWLIRSRGVTFILAAIYLILLFLNRYYHGERFEGYLIYFVPFILLFSGILLERLGAIILAAVLVLNIRTATQALATNPYNFASINKTAELYKGQKISIYQNNPNSSMVAYPLYLSLLDKNAIGQKDSVPLEVILDSSPKGYHLVKEFKDGQEVNQKEVYDDLIGWLQKHQLRSSFNLQKYLWEKLL